MNSDYIISGKGQSAIMGASWAARASALDDARDDGADSKATDSRSTGSTSKVSATENVNRARNRGPEAQNASLTFDDIVDIINPLQHIPIVNAIYRNVTGDKISGFAQVAGSVLYGGPLGIISGVANAVVQEETGSDMGATTMAALFGNDADKAKEPVPGDASGTTMLAQNDVAADAANEETAPAAVADAAPAPDKALDKVESVPLVADAAASGKARQPFGGIMDAGMIASAQAGAPSVGSATVASAEKGQKFFALDNAVRRGDGEAPKMPLKSEPDVRMKPIHIMANNMARDTRARTVAAPSPEGSAEKTTDTDNAKALAQGAAAADATADSATAAIPLVSKTDAANILGLDAKTTSAAALTATAHPALAPNGNPLPPQLIEDMMKAAMDKYQKGLNSGQLPRPTVDIEG